uniref:Glycoside hydrolase family 1 protein n=1 Tax=Ignisphaera aggregans TaxID=334771 RepID=A0A7C4H2C1_9CREN
MGLEFPERFRWGVSESGFQFEMGDEYRRYLDVNTDWWHWVRDPVNMSMKLVSGDLPEDGVNYLELYKVDHEIAEHMGLNLYRLGIEWSRIFPFSTKFVEVDVELDGYGIVRDVKITDEVLKQLDELADHNAIDIYRNIILDLRSRGFKVILNLSHFTLPYWIHNPIRARASCLNKGPRGVVEDSFPIEFAKFAAYVAWKFGDIVDMWVTFNEPMVPVELGYMGTYSGFPPGVNRPDIVPKALLNIAVAHALAYRVIKRFDMVKADEDSSSPAEVGIVHNIIPSHPIGDEESSRASEHYSYFHNHLLLEAIVHGKFDEALDGKTILNPKVLGHSLDWLGINYYTRIIVRRQPDRFEGYPILDFEAVSGYGYACIPYGLSKAGRKCDGMGWEMYPEGLLEALDVGRRYNSVIYVTENGVSDSKDILRPSYLVNHLYVILLAIERGIDVKGYLHWALTDNYEWTHGFKQKFGLYEVDLITKERRARHSANIYKQIVTSNSIPRDYLRYLINMGDIR